jgi:hypothetical protein
VVKRPKLSKSLRDQRLKDLEDELSDYKQQIDFKEKRITVAINSEEYGKCDQLKNEIILLKQTTRELEAERKRLKILNAQSESYYKRKERSLTPASESEQDIPDIPLSDETAALMSNSSNSIHHKDSDHSDQHPF